MEESLSKNQSGFRPERSTAEYIWTHRYIRLTLKALTEETIIKISGIDMSAAFDTINRRHLLDRLKTIVDEDGQRLIQFRLSGTVIGNEYMVFQRQTIHNQCKHSIGRQLKSGAIHCMFRTCSQRSPTYMPRPTTSFEAEIPNKITYADN